MKRLVGAVGYGVVLACVGAMAAYVVLDRALERLLSQPIETRGGQPWGGER